MGRIEREFGHYRQSGDPRALSRVFDRCAPLLWHLASHLAADEHECEDLVQTTFLVAIEKADSWTESRPLLPWLTGILTKRAQEFRRRRNRVLDAERLPARSVRGPEQSASDRELRDELAAAIEQLPSPYRDTLREHLLEERDSREIASRAGVRHGTVRMRIHRGLSFLRKRLPRGLSATGVAFVLTSAAHARMRALVLEAARAPGAVAVFSSNASLAGVVLMTKWTAALSILALGILTWVFWPAADNGTSGPNFAGSVVSSEAESSPSPEAGAAAGHRSVHRTPRAPESEPLRTAALAARLRWSDGTPASGVMLRLRGAQWTHVFEDWSANSDAAGRVRLEGLPPGSFFVALDRCPALAAIAGPGVSGTKAREPMRVELAPGEEKRIELRIPRGSDVVGRVVCPEGKPVGGARIWLSERMDPATGSFVATSGPDGRFALRSVERGRYLGALRAGRTPGLCVRLESKEGAKAELRLVVGPEAETVHGVVRDAATGAAVAGARVLLGAYPSIWSAPMGFGPGFRVPMYASSDATGGFRVSGVPEGTHAWQIAAAGFAPSRGVVLVESSRTNRIECALDRGFTVSGTVSDSGGARCSSGVVVLQSSTRARAPRWMSRLASLDENGEFRLAGIPAGRPARLELTVRDPATGQKLGRLERSFEARVGEERRWDARLPEGTRIDGVLVDENGEPLPGYRLMLQGSPGARRATTDASGRFCFRGLSEASHELSIYGPDLGTSSVLLRETLRPGEGEHRIVLPRALRPSARIRGRLEFEDGTPLGGIRLSVVGASQAGPILRSRDEDGVFTAGPFPPGRYEVRLFPPGCPRMTLGSFELRSGELDTGVHRLRRPVALQASIRYEDGSPVESGYLEVLPAGPCAGFASGKFSKGRFHNPAVWPGRYSVRIWQEDVAPFERTLVVHAKGPNEHVLEVRRGTRTRFVLEPDSKERRKLQLTLRTAAGDDVVTRLEFRLEPNHEDPRARSFTRSLVPGTYDLQVWEGERQIAGKRFRITRAGVSTLRVRLP